MHPPLEIDIQDIHQLVSSVRVVVTAHGGEEGRYIDVGPDDRVENPFETKVGYAFETFLERVDARNRDSSGRCETFAREESEEGRFAGAVRWTGNELI